MSYEKSLPAEFQARMKELLGGEFKDFLASYEKPRHPSLRVNPLKLSAADFVKLSPWSLTPVPWCNEGYYYSETDRPGKSSMHEAGLYYIQEASAMAVAACSGAKPGERILDLCAAPGGKTTQLAGMMNGSGLLVSNEIHPARAKILSRNVERMGIRNAIVTNETPDNLALHFPGFFDRIIVDAPCSGEGMFRKEDAAIPNWSVENVQLCAARQRDILSSAVEMLKVGGTLVYSTCTFSKEENEDTIQWLKDTYPQMQSVNLPEQLGEHFSSFGMVPSLDGSALRLFPHKLDGEGHFLAVLTNGSPLSLQQSQTTAVPTAAQKNKKQKRASASKSSAADAGSLWDAFVKEYLVHPLPGILHSFGNELYLLPESLSLDHLKVLRPGLHLGTVKKNRFEPDHALALALNQQDFRHTCSTAIDSPEAFAFLRGESLPCSEKGWTALLIDGYPLGWGKSSGGILKNHYPKGLRIN